MWHYCCCGEPEFTPGVGRGWGRGYGPPPWAWPRWGESGPRWGWPFAGPTKAERKEWLEAFKKHLEGRLADVNEELGKL